MKSKNIFKIVFAGIIAFLFLNLFCFVYYNLPVHVTTKTGELIIFGKLMRITAK
jgi:hypothetical protein